MRYLLVIGFYCNLYKKNPVAKLYLNDKLLDEFIIEQYECKLIKQKKTIEKFIPITHLLDNKINIQKIPYIFLEFCPPLRFYELELNNDIKNVKLKIYLENNDNNFTNGFLTRHTYLTLKVCHFFPLDKKKLAKFIKIRDKKIISKNYAWYRRNKIQIFDCTLNGMEWHTDTKKMSISNESLFDKHQISGSGYLLCNLVKKYGIYIPLFSKPYRYNCHAKLLNLMLDKYQQYANQRNND
jgi:hypothetical protein